MSGECNVCGENGCVETQHEHSAPEAVVEGALRRALDSGLSITYRNKRTGEREATKVALRALAREGYAVVKLPEGVAVEHGARLVPRTVNLANMEVDLYAIEDTP